MNHFNESVQYYTRALELDYKNWQCHFNIASAYTDMQQFKFAIKHFLIAIELNPDGVDSRNSLAGVYETLKEKEKAIA